MGKADWRKKSDGAAFASMRSVLGKTLFSITEKKKNNNRVLKVHTCGV